MYKLPGDQLPKPGKNTLAVTGAAAGGSRSPGSHSPRGGHSPVSHPHAPVVTIADVQDVAEKPGQVAGSLQLHPFRKDGCSNV